MLPDITLPDMIDQCHAAADWVFQHSETVFGVRDLFIGGESAGSHLAACALQRLRNDRAVAVQTGGREIGDLTEAWLRPPFENEVSLRNWLVIGLLGLLVVEALLTRTGWRLPLPALPSFERRPREPKKTPPTR